MKGPAGTAAATGRRSLQMLRFNELNDDDDDGDASRCPPLMTARTPVHAITAMGEWLSFSNYSRNESNKCLHTELTVC